MGRCRRQGKPRRQEAALLSDLGGSLVAETEHLCYNMTMTNARVRRRAGMDPLPVRTGKMLRTYKYLLRPTPEQAEKLDFLLD
jgi:hypothetical protein